MRIIRTRYLRYRGYGHGRLIAASLAPPIEALLALAIIAGTAGGLLL